MPTSSRFAGAVHVLTLLELSGGEPVTSECVAASVNTNPAVVRRLLSSRARAGLVASRLGAGGGARLARPAAQITLCDVYHAVEERDVFAMHHSPPNPRCPVGREIQGVLERTTHAAERAMEAELGRRTVADVVRDVRARGRSSRATPARVGVISR
jgi:Rrf2 family protein